MPLSQLLKEFLTATNGWENLSSGADAKRKTENVEKFISWARDFDDAGFQSLIDFSEQIASKKKLSEQEAEAPLFLDDIDAVKIMTIHKAKGLQFPVVFLPKISQEFNNKTSPCLIDETKGIAFKIADKNSGDCNDYNNLCESQKQKNQKEEKRIFYVGATRAEKLLILGITQPKPKRENYNSRLKMLKVAFENLKDNLHGKKIIYIINGRERAIPIISRNNIQPSMISAKTDIIPDIPSNKPETAAPLSLPESRRIYDVSKLMDFARCPLNYYLKHIVGLPEDVLGFSFDNDHGSDSQGNRKLNMLRGTIIHALLEKFPFKNKSNAKDVISSILDNEKSLSKEDVKSLFSEIQTSWSILEKREFIKNIASYKERHTELPFQISFGRDVLIGRVDACIKNKDGNWSVIDFKTGYQLLSKQNIGNIFKVQIEAYALFLSCFAPNQGDWNIIICMTDSEVIFQHQYDKQKIESIKLSLNKLMQDEKDFRKKFASSNESPPNKIVNEIKNKRCPLCINYNSSNCILNQY